MFSRLRVSQLLIFPLVFEIYQDCKKDPMCMELVLEETIQLVFKKNGISETGINNRAVKRDLKEQWK